MIFRPLLLSLAMAATAIAQPAAVQIDLSRPVGESITPDRLYWAFDEGSENGLFAGLVIDRSASGYHGRLFPGGEHPAPSFTEGRFGKGVFFQGETPPYINPEGKTISLRNPRIIWRFSDTPGLWDYSRLDLAGKNFTFGVWLRFHQIKHGEYQSIILVHNGHPPEPSSWSIGLRKNEHDVWRINLSAAISSASTDVLNNGEWHHIGININADKEEVTFWVDGEQLGEPVAMAKPIQPMADPEKARLFCVGESLVGGFSTGFVGDMDEFFITSGIHSFKPLH